MDQAVAQEVRPAVIVPRRGLVLTAALMATFMPAVESTIVATAMPTIVGNLGGFHLFSWVFAVPLLTMAVTIPLYGRLADIYGRKRVFFSGTTDLPDRHDAVRVRALDRGADPVPGDSGLSAPARSSRSR